jgi:FSR family fosmidomycin resistance protein-like MFS transporter
VRNLSPAGVWSAASLIGDALIIPLLERVRGLTYVRWSAVATLLLYIAFLATPDRALKYVLLACLALTTSGWYAILQAQFYASLPGRSGLVMSISSASGAITWTIPWALGMIASQFGLLWAMALLALGPAGLLVGLPRGKQ